MIKFRFGRRGDWPLEPASFLGFFIATALGAVL
jgi:hypothetical protein